MTANDEQPAYDGDVAYTKLTNKVKRGTGTRDQDTTKLVTRHPDPEQAALNHQEALEAVRAALQTTRSMQPEADTDD
jgi:hypothetical protein